MQFQEENKEITNSKKEATWTLIVYLAYFLWSISTAYYLGSSDPDEYSYILGFPEWFFYSCILAYPLACIAVYILTHTIFKDKSDN